MHAALLGAEQVHVQAEDLLSHPLFFLWLIHKHRVSHTFAPNFFLHMVERKLEEKGSNMCQHEFDLSCSKKIVSGGEANVVQTCIKLLKLLSPYGLREDAICTAYGLTESCGGITYRTFSSMDELAGGHVIASVGTSIPGAQIRIATVGGGSRSLRGRKS